MKQIDEQSYVQGERAIYKLLLQECLSGLNPSDLDWKRAELILEREEAIIQLRNLCREFGDNDWDENLRLADVIEKHLGRHLYEGVVYDAI